MKMHMDDSEITYSSVSAPQNVTVSVLFLISH